jgi:hypothetical protein
MYDSQLMRTIALVALAAMPSYLAAPAHAQDASFGCKVLLCAAATTPGWSAIPYCVPVMAQLFTRLDKGDPWPSCPEGGQVSGLNYQPYLPCPAGTVAGSTQGSFVSSKGGGGVGEFAPSANGNLCGKQVWQQGNNKDGTSSGYIYVTSARPIRKDPYNVVITPTGSTPQQFWFSLHAN